MYGTIWTNGTKYAHNQGGTLWDDNPMVYCDDLTQLQADGYDYESVSAGVSNTCGSGNC